MKTLTIVLILTFAARAQQIEPLKTTIVITAKPVEPGIDRRNS
jgi:hypothetical protein